MTIEQLIMGDNLCAAGLVLSIGVVTAWGCFYLGKELGKKRGKK